MLLYLPPPFPLLPSPPPFPSHSLLKAVPVYHWRGTALEHFHLCRAFWCVSHGNCSTCHLTTPPALCIHLNHSSFCSISQSSVQHSLEGRARERETCQVILQLQGFPIHKHTLYSPHMRTGCSHIHQWTMTGCLTRRQGYRHWTPTRSAANATPPPPCGDTVNQEWQEGWGMECPCLLHRITKQHISIGSHNSNVL